MRPASTPVSRTATTTFGDRTSSTSSASGSSLSRASGWRSSTADRLRIVGDLDDPRRHPRGRARCGVGGQAKDPLGQPARCVHGEDVDRPRRLRPHVESGARGGRRSRRGADRHRARGPSRSGYRFAGRVRVDRHDRHRGSLAPDTPASRPLQLRFAEVSPAPAPLRGSIPRSSSALRKYPPLQLRFAEVSPAPAPLCGSIPRSSSALRNIPRSSSASRKYPPLQLRFAEVSPAPAPLCGLKAELEHHIPPRGGAGAPHTSSRRSWSLAAELEPRGGAGASRRRWSLAAELEPRGGAGASRRSWSLAAALEPRGGAGASRRRWSLAAELEPRGGAEPRGAGASRRSCGCHLASVVRSHLLRHAGSRAASVAIASSSCGRDRSLREGRDGIPFPTGRT